ncbi:hypothetical protein [Oceanicoccus sp. KOV_DT_Chl]|uniref:hypothetical protein n=1 Tax=Oceanicoccus sp. KOV_DT_Chl TaxID=1904639 RepID=UPI000C7C22AB|nr:hypothetical protein [Oceanicoccus sp. KOV_DT_Chl]
MRHSIQIPLFQFFFLALLMSSKSFAIGEELEDFNPVDYNCTAFPFSTPVENTNKILGAYSCYEGVSSERMKIQINAYLDAGDGITGNIVQCTNGTSNCINLAKLTYVGLVGLLRATAVVNAGTFYFVTRLETFGLESGGENFITLNKVNDASIYPDSSEPNDFNADRTNVSGDITLLNQNLDYVYDSDYFLYKMTSSQSTIQVDVTTNNPTLVLEVWDSVAETWSNAGLNYTNAVADNFVALRVRQTNWNFLPSNSYDIHFYGDLIGIPDSVSVTNVVDYSITGFNIHKIVPFEVGVQTTFDFFKNYSYKISGSVWDAYGSKVSSGHSVYTSIDAFGSSGNADVTDTTNSYGDWEVITGVPLVLSSCNSQPGYTQVAYRYGGSGNYNSCYKLTYKPYGVDFGVGLSQGPAMNIKYNHVCNRVLEPNLALCAADDPN